MSTVVREPARLDFDLVRSVFDHSAVGLVVITPEGVFRQVNRAFCEMVGYAREEIEGQSFRRITHPDDIASDEEHLRQLRAGGEIPAQVDKRFIHKSGREQWVRRSAAVMRDAQGVALFVIGAFIDLTEQRQKDRALHQMNGFLTAIVENSPVAIYTTDTDGIINFWNPAAIRIFGFTREEAVGVRAPFVPPEKKAEAAELRRRVLTGEVLDGLELERKRADGSTIVIHGAAAPLRDEADRIPGLLAACIDGGETNAAARDLESPLHFLPPPPAPIPTPAH